MDTDCTVFDCVDKEITKKDIEACIHKLKTNRSVQNDQLINEHLSEFCDTILLSCILVRVLYKILNSGVFPRRGQKLSLSQYIIKETLMTPIITEASVLLTA